MRFSETAPAGVFLFFRPVRAPSPLIFAASDCWWSPLEVHSKARTNGQDVHSETAPKHRRPPDEDVSRRAAADARHGRHHDAAQEVHVRPARRDGPRKRKDRLRIPTAMTTASSRRAEDRARGRGGIATRLAASSGSIVASLKEAAGRNIKNVSIKKQRTHQNPSSIARSCPLPPLHRGSTRAPRSRRGFRRRKPRRRLDEIVDDRAPKLPARAARRAHEVERAQKGVDFAAAAAAERDRANPAALGRRRAAGQRVRARGPRRRHGGMRDARVRRRPRTDRTEHDPHFHGGG